MGASQSSTGGQGRGGAGNGANPDGPADYYDLLSLEPSASTDDIRKAYRKMALKYHPDKNPDDVEEANKRFRKIQEAYEVLSDETERAWYDSHREAILRGGEYELRAGGGNAWKGAESTWVVEKESGQIPSLGDGIRARWRMWKASAATNVRAGGFLKAFSMKLKDCCNDPSCIQALMAHLFGPIHRCR